MNILFTGIGGPTPLGLAKSIKQAFPESRCIGVDGSPWSASLYNSEVYDAAYQTVLGSHPDYWPMMEDVIQKEAIDFAFVVPETEILVWSKRQSERPLPCPALIQDHRIANFCFDKLKVATLLHDIGLTPATAEFESADYLPLDFPFWIRVKSGAGALGALKIESGKDLATWLTLHNHRQDFMMSEFLPGRNYACKLLFFENELLQHASAERINYLLAAAAPSGISGMCARGRLLNRPDLVERSTIALRTISKYLGVPLHGMFTVDFKESADGEPMITEINIRHVSFNYAFALGGVNFTETTVRKMLGLKPASSCPTKFAAEQFFIRGVDAPLRLIPAGRTAHL
ncbi:MAG: hypothetical protein AAFO03_23860 [Bacteroidota bacterium]